ncbi:MAG: ABC transporter ATP-binding protein [Thaumarchaeota archaeon]|nr:ABC transporter ATP-binding protein [Nitrososphaerota archaeon]
MGAPVVRVEGLVKRYGGATALDGVSFEVGKGEVFGLLGPNGAGKTTTVEILEGVRAKTAGVATVLGEDPSDLKRGRSVKRKMGVLPQDFSAFARLTVRENLEFFAGIYDSPVNVPELIGLLKLEEDSQKRFALLSGGSKQRVGVAAALVNDPEIVFLDEPTIGLDPEARRATWKVISDLKDRGKTVVLTTHYMDEAEKLSDRIGILVKGKLAVLGSPAELIGRFGGSKTIVFKNGGDAVFGTLRRFFDGATMEGQDVVLPFENLRDLDVAMGALVGRGLDSDVALRQPTLEEVFLRFAGFRMTESGDAV